MKHRIILLASLLLITLGVCAKKVRLTIDGTTSPSQTTLYLIVNEDTAHAIRVPIVDAKFSVQVKVDANAIIRLHDWKQWPERSVFVLIPDSRHITINTWNGDIQGSPMSQRMRAAIDAVNKASPEGFHIDVFSEDPEEWARAREIGRSMREQMELEQREVIRTMIMDNQDNLIPAWLVYCHPRLVEDWIPFLLKTNPRWAKHPIMEKVKLPYSFK